MNQGRGAFIQERSNAYNDLTGRPPLGTAAALAAGTAGGVATLGSDGKVPGSQLPATSATVVGSGNGLTINMLGDSFGVQAIYQPTDLDISTYQTWTAGQSYLANEVVKSNGYVFYASAAGTAGTTAPTPTAPSDGAITWSWMKPIASRFGFSMLQWAEIFSNERLRWDMSQGYKSTNLGIGKVFITNPGSNYTAPYVDPINGARVALTQTNGQVTGVTVLSPGRATGLFTLNVKDTGSGSGAKLHVTGGGGTFSVSGCYSADFVTRLPDAIASNVDIIILGAPNNDVAGNVPIATSIANLRYCAEQLVAAGKKVVLMGLTPQTSAFATTAQQKLFHLRYNRWGRAFCHKAAWANVNGITQVAWADASGYFCDGSTDNLPIGGTGGVAGAMTQEGQHPSHRGAMYEGLAIAEATRNWYGAPPSYPSRAYSAYDPYDATLNPGGNSFEALPWTASEAIIVGQTRSNNGNVYACTAAGATASSGGPTTNAASITDGTVTWEYCFPAKMSVSLSTAGGGTNSGSFTGVTMTGAPVKGLQLARVTGSASGSIGIGVESPWSNGQAGQRQVFTFSLGGGDALEKYQVTLFSGTIDKLGILSSDLGVTPFVLETEWEISNVAMVTQFQSDWGFANAGASGTGAGKEIMQSASSVEMLPLPNGGKLPFRTQAMILPLNTTSLVLAHYISFNTTGAAGSATLTAKLNHFTFRRANIL